MQIKRAGISIIFGCILAMAFMLGGKVKFSEYSLSYNAQYENAGNTQIFWAEEDEEFSEKKTLLEDVKPRKKNTIKYNIEKENEKIRIDLGYTANNITLSDIKIQALGADVEIDENLIVEENQVMAVNYADGVYHLEVEGEDPYLVFDIQTLIDLLDNKQDTYNTALNIVYAILGIFAAVFIFVKYKKVKELLLWILEIVKEWKLIWKLALNDFRMRYVTSYLGIIWAFVQPIVTTTIYVVVFGLGFKSLPVEGVSFAVWLTTGIIPWFFFQEAWLSATNSLLEYSYLVKKVVFKINVLPVVKIIAAIFVHLFFIAIAIVLQCIYGMPITIYIIQFLYYTICAMALTLGLSYITSALVVFLKDVSQIVSIFLQFGMWLTPIMYRVDMFGATGERILKLNPMFYVVDGYRDAFFQQAWFWEKPGLTLYFWCFTGIVLVIGAKIFKSLEKHFADVL